MTVTGTLALAGCPPAVTVTVRAQRPPLAGPGPGALRVASRMTVTGTLALAGCPPAVTVTVRAQRPPLAGPGPGALRVASLRGRSDSESACQ
jgi:hypothetical protein